MSSDQSTDKVRRAMLGILDIIEEYLSDEGKAQAHEIRKKLEELEKCKKTPLVVETKET